MAKANGKVFCDPIHGHIELHPLLVEIIDTPQFQRLRYIKQLGGCSFVFPGAVHTRFEHSIGVCHLAGELVETLRINQPDLNITDVDVLCIKIAGLCHDLGHGPFSHLFDGMLMPLVEKHKDLKLKHEHISTKMFKELINKNDLESSFQEHNILQHDCKFITELIEGPSKDSDNNEWPYKGRPKEKEFLYQIVANEKNGIDVDKWDYFARDCHYLGVTTNFDYRRFMKFVRVIKVKVTNEGKTEQLICTRDKEVGNAYEMFHTRYTLHRIAYQHKTNKIIEHMICDALLKADGYISTLPYFGDLQFSKCVGDISAYTKLTDNVFHQILHSDTDDLKDSRELLINIQKRKLYKFIGHAKPKKMLKKEEDQNIASEINSKAPEGTKLKVDDLLVTIVKFDYGRGEKNPIDDLWFYCKDQIDVARHINKDEVSYLLPETFMVQQIRVYCKKFDDADVIADAHKSFKEWCKTSHYVQQPVEEPDENAPLIDQNMDDATTSETSHLEATPEKEKSENKNEVVTKDVRRKLEYPSKDPQPSNN